ncbi:DUF975 family protein [Butyricicoccus porcorum]|uniref:DUF975 domain-containing protein n=1 Tax=Butyricicoccus porcorum TaxID=1945634 RepID=A0A252F1B7_9FIRM|nr:DUF975 family protein [Butyricicoccus porcorum]MCI6926754.1 DUF975 family protein [Butyricicoccus porcorum]MDD6986923.1 DUF975 family protein [Butyricicoccus porcorum]MDY4482733.1 DUF975 family protein [Butyricicoccus porcorum]OUM19519.1 hypothetical protein CBW42_12710 [Butyricicoccus porcorum]
MGKQHADNVFGSKLAAKQDIAASLWPILGATLLYLIPGVLLSLVLRTACFDADGALRELSDMRLLAYAGAYLLATLLIDKPLYFGLTQFYALRRAGAHPAAGMVTMCLGSGRLYAKSIRLTLVLALFSALWAVPLAAVAYGAVYAVSLVLPNSLGLFLSWEIVIVAVFLYACMVVRYQCAYTLLAERKDLGCWRAVRMAAETFRGHKREVLSLLLSFCFWFLLTLMLGGIPMIYVYPYFMLSVYHLFDRIRGVQIRVAPPEADKE